MIAVIATSARAEVIYTTFDPVTATFTGSFVAFSDTSGQSVYSAEFTPTNSGPVNKLIAGVSVDNLTVDSAPATYTFYLYQGGSVDPFNFSPAPIDTFTATVSSPPGGLPITSVAFNSADHPFLNTGATYWLYQRTSPGESQPLEWGVANGSPSGKVDAAFVNSGPNTTHDITTQTLPAFELLTSVDYVPAPEPGYIALVSAGLIALVAFRYGRSRRTSGAASPR